MKSLDELKQEQAKISEGTSYLDLKPAEKFVGIENNFINYESKLKPKRQRPITVSVEEDNNINTLAYFQAQPQASISIVQNKICA